jgi:hypothetical protein
MGIMGYKDVEEGKRGCGVSRTDYGLEAGLRMSRANHSQDRLQ